MILGLTGGIATGKSTVSRVFRRAGVSVIDADAIVHKLQAADGPALAPIRRAFGTAVFHADGTLDRQALGQRVFHDSDERDKLNAIMRPLVRKEILHQIDARQGAPLVVLDIPLLYEAGYAVLCDMVMVVYVPEAVQLARLMQRDGLSEDEAEQRVHAQDSIESKRERADIVIDNRGSVAETEAQVRDFLREHNISSA